MQEFTAGPDDEGRRLDRVLRRILPDVPLSAIHRVLRKGAVRVDGRRAQAGYRLQPGETIRIPAGLVDDAVTERERLQTAAGAGRRSGSIALLATGPHLIAVNKPPGMATHGPGSLQQLVNEHLRHAAEGSLAFRPAPLHRLDRGTSGVVICGASIHGARRFSQLLRERRVVKWYLGLFSCRIESACTWRDRLVRDRKTGITRAAVAGNRGTGETPGQLAGDRRDVRKEEERRKRPSSRTETRPAAAEHEAVLEVFPMLHSRTAMRPAPTTTLAAVRLQTGRRHQVRAQAAARDCPLVGDTRYGGPPAGGGYVLHAVRLEPTDGTELLGQAAVSAPLPAPARQRLARVFREDAIVEALSLFFHGRSPAELPQTSDTALDPAAVEAFHTAHRE